MEIEQSFWVPESEDPSGSKVRCAASAYARRHREYCFSVTASMSGDRPGWRVWRVEVIGSTDPTDPTYFSKADIAEMRKKRSDVARKASGGQSKNEVPDKTELALAIEQYYRNEDIAPCLRKAVKDAGLTTIAEFMKTYDTTGLDVPQVEDGV